MTIAFGELGQLVMFPMAALTWLACQGIVHFVIALTRETRVGFLRV
jgi:hypothetical protein